jgi:hypothetical protein
LLPLEVNIFFINITVNLAEKDQGVKIKIIFLGSKNK